MIKYPSVIYYWELTITDKKEAPNPLICSELPVSEFTMHRLFSNFEAARTQIGIVREKVCEKFGETFDFTVHNMDGYEEGYHGAIITKKERIILIIDLEQKKARIYNEPSETEF